MEGAPESSALAFDDFSGGRTDYYLGGSLNKFKTADNLLLIKHGTRAKLFTRPGSEIFDASYYQIPAAQRIGALKYFNSTLFYQSARKFYYVSGSWVTLQGPTGNDVFPAGVDTTASVSLAVWNKHLFVGNDQYSRPQKIYKDGASNWQLRTAGMPRLASSPTVTKTGGTGSSFLYRFLYKYSYDVGTVTFIDRGAATEVALADSGPPEVNNVAITAIPALANGVIDNYDTASASLKVEIYRTTDGGSNFFFVAAVTNGTATYTDSTSDAVLQTHEPLYTEGGAPDNDTPPLCKALHVMDDKGYYGNLKVNGQILANRVVQSVPGDIDSVPATFFAEVQDDIVAISSVRSNPVVLCQVMIYRLDGAFDFLGQGAIIPQKISDTAGCISQASVVQTLDGIFWAGTDGFYFTDGFQVIRISDGNDQTFKLLTLTDEQRRRIVGKFDPKKKRIWWTTQSASADCDSCWILDLNWPLTTDMPFTTASGGESFAPTALEFISGQLVRADKRGYTFLHSDTVYTDPKINVLTAPSTWDVQTIIYDFVSMATDFGTAFVRKLVSYITINCKNETNLSLQINSINDDGRKTSALSPIRFRGNITWGDPDVIWGDPTYLWNYQGLIDEGRRFPAGGLRCEYKQVELTNAQVVVISSDLLGICNVDATLKTATLADTVTYDWPSNAVDYYLAFANDGYINEYLVTARTADVLTFQDSGNVAPSAAGTKWVLRGRPKGEIMNLLGFTLGYAVFGQTQHTFQKTETGEVGA